MSWKKLIPKAQVLDTQKKYFGQYFYRLELLAHGARSLDREDIQYAIQSRIASYRNINYGGSWGGNSRWHQQLIINLSKSDIEWLQFLQQAKHALPADLKIRIEEPKIQIYAVTESALEQFIQRIPRQFRKYAQSVSRPADDQQLSLLESGIRIVKNTPKYRYKISLRDGKFSAETKQSMLNYLEGLEDLVKLPQRLREQLRRQDFGYIWDCYVYTNDPSIVMFMQIINPSIVRSITEMASVEQINTSIKEI